MCGSVQRRAPRPKDAEGYRILAIEVGNVFEGKVTGVKPFGAFVALPEGKSGMVHISEVSNEFVQDINAVIKEGQQVNVKVISISPEGKIALSIKQLLPKPERPAGPRRSGPQGGGRSGGGKRAPRSEAPRVWQGARQSAPSENMSFEDMMSRFKSQSEDKLGDLDLDHPNRRRGGASRGGRR